jgi:UDP-N-acetylglucosamine 1-carboxyvinyltransferase
MLTREYIRLWDGLPKEKKTKNCLEVTGGRVLNGSITADSIGGDKNATTKLMIAACLTDGPSTFYRMPRIGEIDTATKALRAINIDVAFSDDEKQVTINPLGMTNEAIPQSVGELSRLSIVAAGMLLGKYGEADVPLPQADQLGQRPTDITENGFIEMGATLDKSEPGRLRFKAENGLKGIDYTLKLPSQTATESLLLAMLNAQGPSILRNVSEVSQVDELLAYLTDSGAQVKRFIDKKGQPSLSITPVEKLQGREHTLELDDSVIITYACAAIATKSKGVFIEGAKPKNILPFLDMLTEMGGGYYYDSENEGMWFYHHQPLKAPESTIATAMEPDITSSKDTTDQRIQIRTDWQGPLCILFLLAQGQTNLEERVFEKRFGHLQQTREHNEVAIFPPQVSITGKEKLQPIDFEGTADVRAIAFSLLYALTAEGKSTITHTQPLERGYGRGFINNLQQLGAQIK